MLLVDTHVLVDVLEDDADWADWSIGQLRAQSQVHRLAINPIIYSGLSLAISTTEALDRALEALELSLLEIPKPALFLAGKAFVRDRREGGIKGNVLSEFFFGAHAAVGAHTLLTRDPRRYRTCFPTVTLISPDIG